MKIAQITSSFPLPGESPYLGPENVVYNLVYGLKKAESNLSIDIITIRNDINEYFSHKLIQDVVVHYYPRIKHLPRTLGDPLIIKNVLYKNRYDLVHSHSSAALVCSAMLQIPKILTIHGIFNKEKDSQKNPLIKIGFYDLNTLLLKRLLPKLDGVVAIGPHVLDVLEKNGFNKKKIYQINNPVDELFFKTESKYDSNILLYPARISTLKNQLVAIRALSLVKQEIKDVELVFAGEGDEKYLKLLKNEAKKNNLDNSVKFLGKVDRKGMIDLYYKSSLVYLLSFHENQPMALLEAMSSGIPVIASNIKSNINIVENGVTGYLVDSNNYEKVAEYTIELLNNKQKRTSMGKNARKIAKKKYCPSVIAAQTLKMYDEIMG